LAGIFSQALRLYSLKQKGALKGGKIRQPPRLYTSLPIEYSFSLPAGSTLLSGPALLKNIGKDGAYLECPELPDLSLNQVGHFRCRLFAARIDEPGAYHLAAKAAVCRLVRTRWRNFPYGMEVEFLAGPLICYHNFKPQPMKCLAP